MTLEIGLVLGVVVAALILFVGFRLRMDVVALVVLAGLVLTGLVNPAEALAGFSNGAVVAVWAMFILSAALTRAGIADLIGRTLLRLTGRREARVTGVLMLVAGAASFFMNKIGVATLMLPVVTDMARRKRLAASRLLMPLSQATVLGGLTTLVANPPNLLISESLDQSGFEPFGVLDFVPLGVPLLALGTVYVVLAGRLMLPQRKAERDPQRRSQRQLRMQYGLQARNIELRVVPGSMLVGKSLAESRIGSAAGLLVLALVRRGNTMLMPSRQTVLYAGDKLLVQGRLDRIQEFQRWSELVIEREAPVLQSLMAEQVALVEAEIAAGSRLDSSLLDHGLFRRNYHANVLAVRRGDRVGRAQLSQVMLKAGDRMLLQIRADSLAELERSTDFAAHSAVDEATVKEVYHLDERLFVVRVPRESAIVGAPISRRRFANAFDFRLLGIFREGELRILPDADEKLEAGDLLLIQGDTEDLDVLRGLQELVIEPGASSSNVLDSERLGMIEATLDPHSSLVGRSVADIGLREKYGLELAAVWRKGEALRVNLDQLTLALGDALLLVGPREQLRFLERDRDFVVLTPVGQRVVDSRKAPVAAAVLLGVIVSVLAGWLPIGVAALLGATLMVVTGCIRMEEAYRAIEWQVIFVIACLLPLGTAMQETGAAQYLAGQLMEVLEPLGPWWVIAGLYVVTAAANTILPAAALVVLMSPIVLSASAHLGIAPHTAMMAVAMAASASVISPVSHPAHVMVMGPGGYRLMDYLKVGLPLAALIFAVVMLLLPVIWPLVPV